MQIKTPINFVMKKTFLLLLLPFTLFAGQEKMSKASKDTGCFFPNSLQARAGYFLFTKEANRKIFDTGSVDLELEYNWRFFSHTSLFLNGNFTWDNGYTVGFKTPTTIYLPTFSFGLKQFFNFFTPQVQGYLGFGAVAAIPMTQDHSPYIPTDTVRFSPGILWKSGILFYLPVRWTLDLFFDYYLSPVGRRIDLPWLQQITDVGGFRTGLGLGVEF